MIFRILAIIIAFLLVVLGLGAYLSPDDLAKCQQVEAAGECREFDAVVVISGGDTDGRTDEAIRLYHQGWAPVVIVSGAAADKSSISNAEAMRRRAVSQGVPREAVIAEPVSETTKQNALEVAEILRQRQAKRVILVTSGYHMRRAGLEFSQHLSGVEVWRHPTTSDKHWSSLWWLTPWGWWTALGELVKIGAFYIGGSR